MVQRFFKYSFYIVITILFLTSSTCGDNPLPLPGIEDNKLDVKLTRIDAPTTWTDQELGPDYIVHNNIEVFSDLIIEPGTSIIFLEDAGLSINKSGVLKAEGEIAKPIVFTGNNGIKGEWRGLELGSTKKSVLNHCNVEYAGAKRNGTYSDCAVYVTGTASITNSSIQLSAYHGVGLAVDGVHEADIQDFENNILLGNDGHPIFAPARLISKMDLTSCNYQSNEEESIAVYINNSNRDIDGSHSWEDPTIPYLLTTDIKPKANWTLKEGTQLLMEEGTAIHIRFDGSININGSVDAPVVIKSNQNLPGSWKGIFIENDGQNKINQLQIYHGGSSPFIDNVSPGNITVGSFVGNPVKLDLFNSLIAESAACGISVLERANVAFKETNSSFNGNSGENMCLN